MEKSSILIALSAILIASIAQLLLKSSAGTKKDQSLFNKIINVKVIVSYGLMFLSSFLNVLALRHLELKLVPVMEATGFIWVPLFSWLFLREKPTKNNIGGCIMIILGMCLFAGG